MVICSTHRDGLELRGVGEEVKQVFAHDHTHDAVYRSLIHWNATAVAAIIGSSHRKTSKGRHRLEEIKQDIAVHPQILRLNRVNICVSVCDAKQPCLSEINNNSSR